MTAGQAPHLHHLVQPSLRSTKSYDILFAVEEMSLQKAEQLAHGHMDSKQSSPNLPF